MTTFDRHRKRRIRDFEKRARLDEDVREYRNWRYVTVHPFADELKLLQALKLQPKDCKVADVWWHTGNDIALLQTVACGDSAQSTTYTWFGHPPYLSIIVRLPEQVTSIELLHEAMDRIMATGLPDKCTNYRDQSVVRLFRW